MGVNSEKPTSRRGYLSESELEQMADITVTDSTEGADRISQSEEIIDAYVGYQNRFLSYEILGRVDTAASGTTMTLQTSQQNIYEADFFKLCEVEIISGTGEGQRRKITASTKAGVLTLDVSLDTALVANSSGYRIYQLGKFPRQQDVRLYSDTTPSVYFKTIPEEVKRATAAQVSYLVEKGDSFINGDDADKSSESIGDYSYSKGNANITGGFMKLVAPRAKILLRGFVNRTGELIA